MSRKSNILVIGDNCFDITVKSKFDFAKDKNFLPDYYVLTPAGTGVNFAVSFSKLGGNASYFTPISGDSFGEEIKKYLVGNGVKVFDGNSLLSTALIIAIINDVGDRTTFALIKNSAYTEISFEKFKSIKLENLDGVYISGGINTEEKVAIEILKIAQLVREKGINLYFDPQIRIGKALPWFTDVSEKISEISSIVFANTEEFSYMNLSSLKNTLAIEKRGEFGAAAFEKGREVFSVEGLKVPVSDTTGAGDVFNAAFLIHFTKNNSVCEALKFANAAGAVSVSKDGVYSPSYGEVQKLLGYER